MATLALGAMSMARAACASWEAREVSAEPRAFLVADFAARTNAWVRGEGEGQGERQVQGQGERQVQGQG